MRATLTLFVLAASTGLSGCLPTEDDYRESFARAQCELWRSCSELSFRETWDDLDDCVAAQHVAQPSCDFHPDEAGACLAAVRKVARTCEPADLERLGPCQRVYTCPQPGDTGVEGAR